MSSTPTLLILLIAIMLPSAVLAEGVVIGDLRVDAAWARATAGMASNGVVYMTLSNHGEETDSLIDLVTPIAQKAALHETMSRGDILSMRSVTAVEVLPGESTVLGPGGLHVMLMGLRAPIDAGQNFPLTLVFKKAGTVTVQVTAWGIGALKPGPVAQRPDRLFHDGLGQDPQAREGVEDHQH